MKESIIPVPLRHFEVFERHRLVRFAKITLEPNAFQALTFILNRDDLSFVGPDNKPVVEPGEFEITVGSLHARFTLSH